MNENFKNGLMLSGLKLLRKRLVRHNSWAVRKLGKMDGYTRAVTCLKVIERALKIAEIDKMISEIIDQKQ